ncbi:MAG: helix-turn-helix transcriptional regulator [Solirubrobacteraceae bacterium]
MLGYEQEDLSLIAGMARSTISRLENGRHNPRRATQERLANALGCEVTEIFPLNEQRPGDQSGTLQKSNLACRPASAEAS